MYIVTICEDEFVVLLFKAYNFDIKSATIPIIVKGLACYASYWMRSLARINGLGLDIAILNTFQQNAS